MKLMLSRVSTMSISSDFLSIPSVSATMRLHNRQHQNCDRQNQAYGRVRIIIIIIIINLFG